MIRQPCKFIDAISTAFDTEKSTLEVEFQGGVYQFFDVSVQVADSIYQQQGPDKSLLKLLKGKYRFCKV